MMPKMMADKAQRSVVPQARIPQMQNLRDGGGTMKVFGNGNVPKMQNLRDGGHMKHKK